MKTPSDKLFIPPSWRKSIAENVLRDGSPDDLTRILVEHGFPEPLARLEVDAPAAHPYVEAARSLGRQLKKRDWVFDTLRLLHNESKKWERNSAKGLGDFRYGQPRSHLPRALSPDPG